MNKKLIALAVAAAIAPAAAMADSGNVAIYGVMSVSYDNVSTGATNQDTLHRISSNNSYMGFKGTEDLGNGLNAVWQIEQTVNVDNGAATTGGIFSGAQRNTFIGLSSKTMGTVLAGTHDTPYKLGTARLDVFADTLGDYNNIIGNVNGANVRDLRLGNVLAYISPTINGFHAAIATSMLNESGNNTSTVSYDNPSAWTATAIYDNGPLFASLSYEKQNSGTSATVTSAYDTKGTKLGLGYNFGQGTKAGLVYERLSDSRADQAGTRNAYALNVAHTMGANTIKVQYGKANDGASTADTAATNWTIGADHAFSKRSSIYALYTNMSNGAGATYGIGVASGAYVPATGSDDPHAVSIGLKHSF